jgi:hypothetical protein
MPESYQHSLPPQGGDFVVRLPTVAIMLVCGDGRSTLYQGQKEEESPVPDFPEILAPETTQIPTSRKEREKWGTRRFSRQAVSQRQGWALY